MTTRDLIAQECSVDRVNDDVTCRLLGEEGRRPAIGLVRSREAGVFSGEAVCAGFQEVFGEAIHVESLAREGQALGPGETVARLEAPVSTLLSLERTLLNLLSHLCGVATLTQRFVQAVRPHRTRILATRKTLPGLRELQLTAVRAGGGWVHRRSLSDGILIKDNHLEIVGAEEILRRARFDRSPLHRIEIEVQSLAQLERVLKTPPDLIMLDNLNREDTIEAIRRIGGRSAIEVSGGVRLETVSSIAELGVDYISVGALTHSVKALDLTLDLTVNDTPEKPRQSGIARE